MPSWHVMGQLYFNLFASLQCAFQHLGLEHVTSNVVNGHSAKASSIYPVIIELYVFIKNILHQWDTYFPQI
jgi:hypothetical protein